MILHDKVECNYQKLSKNINKIFFSSDFTFYYGNSFDLNHGIAEWILKEVDGGGIGRHNFPGSGMSVLDIGTGLGLKKKKGPVFNLGTEKTLFVRDKH